MVAEETQEPSQNTNKNWIIMVSLRNYTKCKNNCAIKQRFGFVYIEYLMQKPKKFYIIKLK